jgi:ankyrin repeat protein
MIGAQVNARSKAGYTPLMFAARAGHIDLVQALLAAGANVNDVETNGFSVLDLAIANAHYELAALLLTKGADPNGDTAGWAPLHLAIMVRNPEQLPVPDPIPTGKLTSLDLIKALLARGGDPNGRMKRRMRGGGKNGGHLNQVGATPFLLAAECADLVTMRLLLESGADPMLKTKDNATALMAAAGTGHSQGKSPGSESDALEAVKMTLALGNDINAVDDSGFTAMHGAAIRGANSIIQFLVDRGARMNVKNKSGQLPLTIAEEGDGANSDIRAQPQAAALLRTLMASTDRQK